MASSPVQFPGPACRHTPQPPVPGDDSPLDAGPVGDPVRGDAIYHTYRSDLAQVRALVLKRAREAGLAEARINDLVLAVSEVAANTLRHTDSSGTLAIWQDAVEVVCEIHDSGTITDPLAGQRKPAPDAAGGHGLWLAYQVCDQVELTSGARGTTIRMHMRLRPPVLPA